MSSIERLKPANAARQARIHHKSSSYGSSGLRRGNDAVWRHSQYAGETERRAWLRNNVFGARERRARLQAMHEWNYASKGKGANWGPLGPSGERFLDSLMGLRCFRTGRLDLSIKAIAGKLHMCVDTVVRYIARLTDLNLLVKLRRSRPVDDPTPGGPRVEQITNAYWFALPADLAERVRQILGRHVKPADQQDREAEEAEQLATMIAALSAEEFARFRAGDHAPLNEAMEAFGKALDEQIGRF